MSLKSYDPGKPLIFIHLPKTAGTSIRALMKEWYGQRLLPHYYDEVNSKMPKRYDLSLLSCSAKVTTGVMVFGHFNSLRGFGIRDYYPEVDQFVTLMRDPFEAAVSGYFYARKVGGSWSDQSRVPSGELRDFISSFRAGALNHFPVEMSRSNYKEVIESMFVQVGVTSRLDLFLRSLALKLGFEGVKTIAPQLNVTVRESSLPEDLRDIYRENNQLLYEVYEYVLALSSFEALDGEDNSDG